MDVTFSKREDIFLAIFLEELEDKETPEHKEIPSSLRDVLGAKRGEDCKTDDLRVDCWKVVGESSGVGEGLPKAY